MRERRERAPGGRARGERGDEPEKPGQSRLERHVLVYVRDPLLWPVLVVVIAHVAVFVAPLMLSAARDAQPTVVALLAVLGLLSGAGVLAELRRRRRPGAVCVLLGSTWLLSAVVAFTADRYGIL